MINMHTTDTTILKGATFMRNDKTASRNRKLILWSAMTHSLLRSNHAIRITPFNTARLVITEILTRGCFTHYRRFTVFASVLVCKEILGILVLA